MTNITVKSYRKEREKEIIDGLEKSMEKVGAIVERQAKKNADKPRGGSEHPQRQSGLLISNIGHTTKIEGNTIVAIIGVSSEIPNSSPVHYAGYLEFGNSRQPPYPFLFPAVEMNRDKIVEILKGKFTVD